MEIFAIISLVAGQERHEKATGYARVAQLVEHHLAKVGVAGSSPVSRSSYAKKASHKWGAFFVSEPCSRTSKVRGLACRLGRCSSLREGRPPDDRTPSRALFIKIDTL